jgi:hypothetical protein
LPETESLTISQQVDCRHRPRLISEPPPLVPRQAPMAISPATLRRAVLPRLWLTLSCLILVALVGCSTTQIESAQFGPSSAIESAMMRHYERNASEGNCYHPSIDGFTKLNVLEHTPDRLVVHARYLYRDRFRDNDDGGSSSGACSGFGERTFTLTRGPEGGALEVTMDGQQEEPALRTLIRRLFPG